MPSETLTCEPATRPTCIEPTLDRSIEGAAHALSKRQKSDGHWVFELEADATIPAEYVLLEHYMDRIDAPLEQKIGVYLRRIQGEHGGWPLFHDGAFNLSAAVIEAAWAALPLAGLVRHARRR